MVKPAPTCPPGFENQKWNFSTTSSSNIMVSGLKAKEADIPASVSSGNGSRPLLNFNDLHEVVSKDLFNAIFLQNFSFSPNLTMSKLSDDLNYYSNSKSPVDQFIPTDLMLGFFQSQDIGKSSPIQIKEVNDSLPWPTKVTPGSGRGKGKKKISTGIGAPPTTFQKRDSLLLRRQEPSRLKN